MVTTALESAAAKRGVPLLKVIRPDGAVFGGCLCPVAFAQTSVTAKSVSESTGVASGPLNFDAFLTTVLPTYRA